MFDKKQKIVVIYDGFYDRKAFCKVKIVFIHTLRMMANLSIVTIFLSNKFKNGCLKNGYLKKVLTNKEII